MVGNVVGLEVGNVVDDNEMAENAAQMTVQLDQDDSKMDQNPSQHDVPMAIMAPSESTEDEPYVGQEFESEAAAHAFYNSYATQVGFIIRVSKLSRSRHDGSPIGRQLVCNKEGYRLPTKREKVIRQRAETRVGCRAMIFVRKVNSGKWVIKKFIKEHTHPLTPGMGRRDCIYDQFPKEHDKILELSQQLAIEKKRAATYKRHLEMIFDQIEQQNESLSKKLQHIMNNIQEHQERAVVYRKPPLVRENLAMT